METESDNNNTQKLSALSQDPVQSNSTSNTFEGILPQGGGPLHQPAVSDNTILTDGGSYIAGSVTNEGGINQFGGAMSGVTYIDKRSYYTTPTSPLPTSSSRPNNYIPFPRNPIFQPRPGEFEELERLLFASGTGPKRLRLVGMGGIGKTRLAVELAYRCLDQNHFPDGIFWMPATGTTLSDWQRHLAELAFNTNYLPSDDDQSNPENGSQRARHLCRYLASHPGAVLILDNVENPALIMTALPDLAGSELACAILCTSRVKNWPDGFTPYPVKPLLEEDALHLLLKTTRPALLEEVLAGNQNAEAKGARSVCHAVGYLPLALVHLRGLLARDQYLTLVRLAQVLKERGALGVAKKQDFDAAPLFATFDLSWQQVGDEATKRLFKLASYFPEATSIPLWLLGLAAGLGESGYTILEPLGAAYIELQDLSLVEPFSADQVRLHPLLREFARLLVAKEEDAGTALLTEAKHKLLTEFADMSKLAERAQSEGYWKCLVQVQAASEYAEMLGDTERVLERIQQWLARESSLLGDEQWWPKTIPGLFYQQLYNQSVEEGYPLPAGKAPSRWIRQLGRAGVENQALLREFRHSEAVIAVVFSPDGRKVVTDCQDGIARVWDVASGQLEALLKGHTGTITSVDFSRDSCKVATGSSDNTAKIWEVPVWRPVTTLKGHTASIESVIFSADGKKVVTAADDKTARVWDATTGQQLSLLAEHSHGLICAAFSLDGERAVMGTARGDVVVWDVSNEKVLANIPRHRELSEMRLGLISKDVFCSFDGKFIAVYESFERVLIKDVESQKVLSTLPYYGLTSGAFSFDGKNVAMGGSIGGDHVIVWDWLNRQLLTTLSGHTSNIRSLAFSPDGTRIVSGSEDKTARVWRVVNEKASTMMEKYQANVKDVAISRDGTKVVIGFYGGEQVYEVESGKAITDNKKQSERWVTSVAFSPNGENVAAGVSGIPNKVYVFKIEDGKLVEMSRWETGLVKVLCLEFSPDGQKIAMTLDDESIQVRNVLAKSPSATLSGYEGYELPLVTLHGHEGYIVSVGFSPDGTRLITGSILDETAYILGDSKW